jgi:quercetin dioxygenase-like cupin family protein
MRCVDWRDVESVPASGFPGVSIRWLIAGPEGAERFAMRLFELEPGAEIPLHDHWYEQEMFVVSGRGTASRLDSESAIRAGTTIWVRPGERHGFRADSAEPLAFICCVPLAGGDA